jgi:hypothetical protein
MTNTDKIKLEVIATYEDGEQEIFQVDLNEDLDLILKSENDLLSYLRNVISYPTDSDLFKLSLCWICNEDTVKKYNTIKDSISNNGKYFFQSGELA